MQTFNLYRSRNDWNASKEARPFSGDLAGAKTEALAHGFRLVERTSDGSTWHYAAGAWRKA